MPVTIDRLPMCLAGATWHSRSHIGNPGIPLLSRLRLAIPSPLVNLSPARRGLSHQDLSLVLELIRVNFSVALFFCHRTICLVILANHVDLVDRLVARLLRPCTLLDGRAHEPGTSPPRAASLVGQRPPTAPSAAHTGNYRPRQ